VRRMPEEYGSAKIRLSPEASLKYWRHDSRRYDPSLMALAKEVVKPGAVVWDLGANVGLFSFAAAFASGREGSVLAVEADPWIAELLEESARSAPPSHAPITVVRAAVCERAGRVDLAISSRSRAANHLAGVQGSPLAGPAKRIESVPCLSLDDLLLLHPAPQVLKVDIEGAEVLALRGGSKVLDLEPVLLCEVDDQNVEVVSEMLQGRGYELFDSEEASRPRKRLSLAAFNTLAIPTVGLRTMSRAAK